MLGIQLSFILLYWKLLSLVIIKIIFKAQGNPLPPEIIMKRNWQNYTSTKLNELLSTTNFDIEADLVQDIWNIFEAALLPVIDDLIPYAPFIKNTTIKSSEPSKKIKQKINMRKKLLKLIKHKRPMSWEIKSKI